MTSSVPKIRRRRLNNAGVNNDGSFVLYWMIAHRRLSWNDALDRAAETARKLRKPLVILEALRCDYPWASHRLHQFVLEGMADNAAQAAAAPVCYYPYVEPSRGAGKGLLSALARHCCCVVTDHFPCFFLPDMVRAAAARIAVSFESVDSNGIYPLADTDRVFTTAFSFRNHLQKRLPEFLCQQPSSAPLTRLKAPDEDLVPEHIQARWPRADAGLLACDDHALAALPINGLAPGQFQGGTSRARRLLQDFLDNKLHRYPEERNHPDADVCSHLSPYLHFGHIGSHEVFAAVQRHEEWDVSQCGDPRNSRGRRQGWWNMSPGAEAFLDQLITWRELGFNACEHNPHYASFDSLPDFARETLQKHASDPRAWTYSLQQFDNASTHDPLWNAAQRQLKADGTIHNYLRMLWGKKILEWTPDPQQALDIMIELNNRYAVDGRDPNSYSGIFWVLGRYDRAWGPERPIFGKVRYMSSENAARKLKLQNYLQTWSEPHIDD